MGAQLHLVGEVGEPAGRAVSCRPVSARVCPTIRMRLRVSSVVHACWVQVGSGALWLAARDFVPQTAGQSAPASVGQPTVAGTVTKIAVFRRLNTRALTAHVAWQDK
jgi:hypothetical protein